MDSRLLFSVLFVLLALLSCIDGQRTRTRAAVDEVNQRPRRFGGPRIKRMYAVCPPKFERIGNECYFISSEKLNWLDAQFVCLDKDSKLAEPNKVDDRRLRKHLLNSVPDESIASLWLGGKYDWQKHNWQWAFNGRKMKHQAFEKRRGANKTKNADLQHHCTVMSRSIKYRWSPVPCMEQHYFICQHRMPVVKKDNLQHIYTMWNNTFPNQIANEIEVIFTSKDNGDLRQRFQVDGGRDMRGDETRQEATRYVDRPANLRRGNAPRPRNQSQSRVAASAANTSRKNSIDNGATNKQGRRRLHAKYHQRKNEKARVAQKEVLAQGREGDKQGQRVFE